ncbi:MULTISPECIES: OmpA family protein [Polaromonas]|uniref:OmpA family protein n=1 Tax=Polaromonas aquatica TaxID=332657 RepID=A0ABW1U0M6_9BURK
MTNSIAPHHPVALALFAVVVLAGCSSGATRNEGPAASAQATGLAPQQTRFTDERILSDRQTIEGVQQRLRKLNEAGIPQNSYSLAKAQCWLDTAKSQYHENDRTGYIEESLTEAVKIAQLLEADKSTRAGYDTPLVARSSKLRDDLWAQLSNFKNQPASMACNARTVACAEVRLVRAGHADEQTGWRQATPHIQMVEDALRTAKIEADNCAQPKAGVPVASSVALAPAVAGAAAATSKETYVLLTDTLFRFDKSGAEDMIPGGLQRLADVAQRLKAYKSIQALTVIGYTDRLGSDEYNDKLSEARAKTVQAHLQSLGVKSATTVAQGKGKRDAVSKDCAAGLGREQLIQCLQSDRRVTIEVTGIAK